MDQIFEAFQWPIWQPLAPDLPNLPPYFFRPKARRTVVSLSGPMPGGQNFAASKIIASTGKPGGTPSGKARLMAFFAKSGFLTTGTG
jgi:hypothetical protein